MQKIGLIGHGFVGSALAAVFCSKYIIQVYDTRKLDLKTPNTVQTSLQNLMKTEIIFICVPTPSLENGACDLSIVESVLNQLIGYDGIVVVKSTLLPSTLDSTLKLVFNPEFLTEKNAVNDFKNAARILIGGKPEYTSKVAAVYLKLGYNPDIIFQNDNLDTFALVKYMSNSFLASKVALFNEYYNTCKKHGIPFDTVRRYMVLDKRIGASHTQVPGPDGQFGFSGHCFPKDTEALLYEFPDMTILSSIVEANKKFILKTIDNECFQSKTISTVEKDGDKK